MGITRDEAARHLRDIEETQRRSATAYGYTAAAPFLVLWGIIWAIGYTISDFWPAIGPPMWRVLVVVGSLAGFVLPGVRRPPEQHRANRWRLAAAWMATAAFFFALFAVLQPVSSSQISAVIPLFCALAYVLLGLWKGSRFVVAGILLGALTLGGYFYLPAHFDLWMAVVGGGALTLAGLWMRRI